MKTLLLWDIDCTLIDSGGAGERALKLSLKNEFGIMDDLRWLEYFGRTDLWIARALLEKHHFAADSANVSKFLEGYLKALTEQMHNPNARVLPGVLEILRTVAASDTWVQGLLTGNLRRGAAIKLGHLGLQDFFPFGAFADDAEHRDELGPIASRRAADHHGDAFCPERIIVVGDTPHDISCGKAIGARTIAVATGRYAREQLNAYAPSALFDTLEDVSAFFRAAT